MQFNSRSLREIADMICGNFDKKESFFIYRSSSRLTEFFHDCNTNYSHDGTTRDHWVIETLKKILDQYSETTTPGNAFSQIICTLMDQRDNINEGTERVGALAQLNATLINEGLEAYYGADKRCCLRKVTTTSICATLNPHRPFSDAELKKQNQLFAYLDKCSEDELISAILLPLFRQLGFSRITSAGHKDKALEYGKDIWMKYTLPTQHVLYFGIQVKKGKLDAAGVTKSTNANIAEIYNQLTMMIGHEIFDSEISKLVLVDHAFIIAGGEITKQARNWIGNRLDTTKRSQVLFMDRNDILNLFIVANLSLPEKTTSAMVDVQF